MTVRTLTLCSFAVLAVAPAFADNAVKAVERMFLERAAISAADKSCNLFTDGERLALRSGLYQSEGELLRHNYDPAEIAKLAGQVRMHAKALGCDHPSVLEVAGTIRSSYRQFAKTTAMDYPAARSTWAASRSEHDAWAVMQVDKKSGFIFGLRRVTDEKAKTNPETGEKPFKLALAIAIPYDDKPASAVQLNLRDANKMRDPWLGPLFGGDLQLAPSPRSISRPEWAGKMEEWEDNVGDWFNVYYFSPSAIERLEMLDPREAVQFEQTANPKADAKTKERALAKIVFEVGDFRAARAFAMIPAPAPSALASAASPPKAAGDH